MCDNLSLGKETEMEINFTYTNFNAIVTACSKAVAGKGESREILKYICLDCFADHCTAFGCDGYKAMMVNVPCRMGNPNEKTRVMLKPFKVPNNCTQVVVRIEEERIEIDIMWYHTVLETLVQHIVKGEYLNYEKIMPTPEQRQEYSIAVNPKHLIEILNGMKNIPSVQLHFGDKLHSFLITPNSDVSGITGLVLPMGMWERD